MPNTEQQRQYDELVAAIAEAIPDRVTGDFGPVGGPYTKIIPSITLEDVLRAWPIIPESNLLLTKGRLCFFHGGDDGEWHLSRDIAWHRDNAPETITFLQRLLITPPHHVR